MTSRSKQPPSEQDYIYKVIQKEITMELSIAGTGKIVTEMLQALDAVHTVTVKALFYHSNRSRAKAESLAAQYGINNVTDDFEHLLKPGMPPTVYLGLTNNAHFDYARRALMAGKNVIVEKPFCTSAAEAGRLVQLAHERHLMLFEAVTTWHFTLFAKLRELLPLLGTISLVNCNYSQRSSRYDRYLAHDVAPAFDPALGGGALTDINVYNLDFVTGLFGEPDGTVYLPNRGFNGVDTSGVLLLSYPTMQAVCMGAKDADGPCFGLIEGDKGWIRVNDSVSRMGNMESCIEGEWKQWEEPAWPHRLCAEMKEIAAAVDSADYSTMEKWIQMTIVAMRTLEKARNS